MKNWKIKLKSETKEQKDDLKFILKTIKRVKDWPKWWHEFVNPPK